MIGLGENRREAGAFQTAVPPLQAGEAHHGHDFGQTVNSGDAAAIAANGLQGFRRDTTWVNLSDSLFGPGYNADSIRYIPFAEGDTFQLQALPTVTRSGTILYTMECAAPDVSFLKNMGRNGERLIVNRARLAEDMGSYPGLKIGDLYNWNNNAGNWE